MGWFAITGNLTSTTSLLQPHRQPRQFDQALLFLTFDEIVLCPPSSTALAQCGALPCQSTLMARAAGGMSVPTCLVSSSRGGRRGRRGASCAMGGACSAVSPAPTLGERPVMCEVSSVIWGRICGTALIFSRSKPRVPCVRRVPRHRKRYNSSGVMPVCLAMRASIRGPISSPS